MATPNLEQLSRELAYKLQDPVSSGSADGVRLRADNRLQYINAGYRRLINLTQTLYPELISRIFNNSDSVITLTSNSSGVVTGLDYIEVYDILVRWPSGPTSAVYAYPLDPDEYLGVVGNVNQSFASPDLNTHTIYWTILDGDISIFPKIEYNEVTIRYKKDIVDFAYTTQELNVSKIYWEIILALAASVATNDLGEFNLSQAYYNDALTQLNVFNAKQQQREVEDAN